MKLSTALTFLTLGAAEARAGTRRARRAQDAAADVVTIADSDLVEADSGNGGGMSGCDEDEVGGIVTINYTGGSIDYTGANGLSTIYNEEESNINVNTGIKNGILTSSSYPSGGTGYGGIAFEYNSDTESVKFKSANGSTFDEDACQEYEKICYNGFRRKLEENGDVSEDRRNDCEGKDTVLFCPMSEGQSATFEITDTMRYCGGTRKLQDEEEEVTEDMRPIRLAKAGIKFYITTPDNSCPNYLHSQVSMIRNPTQVSKFAQPSSCYGEDVVAILQCGPTRSRFISQTSDCLYANDCLVNNAVSIAPTNGLGIEHAINLEQCVIRRRSNTKLVKKVAVQPSSTEGGNGRRLAIEEARNIINALGGDLNGSFFETDNIISKDAVDTLRKMSETKYSVDDFDPKAPHHQQEFRIGSNLTPERLAFYELSGENLIGAIGKDNSKAILDFVHESFGATASVSKISLQHANMEQQMFIAPHKDGKDTALVFLGGSDANVVYLNDKEGNIEAQTYPGKALAHGAHTVHSEYLRRRCECVCMNF